MDPHDEARELRRRLQKLPRCGDPEVVDYDIPLDDELPPVVGIDFLPADQPALPAPPEVFETITKGELNKLLGLKETARRRWMKEHPDDVRETKATSKTVDVRKSVLDTLRARQQTPRNPA